MLLARRLFQLVAGLFSVGIGIGFMVRAQIGIAPWDVLSQGISHHVPLSFGMITLISSALVIVFWIPLRQKPGVGTFATPVIAGLTADLALAWLEPQTELLWQTVYFSIGLLLVGFGSAVYIGALLGPGPRDGLMTGLHLVAGWRIWVARTVIEVTVLAAGWVLGGNVGIGTLAFAVLVGPIVGFFMPLMRVRLPAAEAQLAADASEDPPTAGAVP